MSFRRFRSFRDSIPQLDQLLLTLQTPCAKLLGGAIEFGCAGNGSRTLWMVLLVYKKYTTQPFLTAYKGGLIL